MSLQQVLNHRSFCLIHSRPMRYYIGDLIVDRFDDNLHLSYVVDGIGRLIAILNNNGTYQDTKSIILDNPMIVEVMCDHCRVIPGLKKRRIGLTTVESLEQQYHRYDFYLALVDNIHVCLPGTEEIKCNDDKKIYHVVGNLLGTIGTLTMGNYEMYQKLDQIVKGMTTHYLPSMDMSMFTSITRLIEKCKLYNLFG